MLQKASQIGQSTGLTMKKSSNHSDNLTSDDQFPDGDQELDKYLVLLLGLQRLLIWERQLLADVIPTSRHSEVFSKLAQSSIEMVVKDAEIITNRVIRNIVRKEWSSALGVFSALKHVILLQPDIDKACDLVQRQQLSGVLNRLTQTGTKALEQFLELVKSDIGSNLVGMSTSTLSGYTTSNVPRDATVHELTSNAIWFIEHLLEHCEVIGSVLQTDSLYLNQLESAFSNKTLLTDEKNRALLGLYIKKVLSELNLTIVTKCEQYNDVATKHLFRLNNIHYILKSLQRSNLIELVSMTEPDCERNYQDLIQDLKKSYQKSWIRLLTNISVVDLPKPVNGKIKDKERAIIKERFSTFNKELEDACKTQRGISVPDIILREGLKRDNAEHVIPQYYAFYET